MNKELLDKLWEAIKKTNIPAGQRKQIFEQFQQSFDTLDADTLKKLDAEVVIEILIDQMKTSGVKSADIKAFQAELKAEAKPQTKPEVETKTPAPTEDIDPRVVAAEAAEIEAAQKGEPIVPKTRGPKIHKYEESILRNIIADIKAQGGSKEAAQSVVSNLPGDLQNIWNKNIEIAKTMWKDKPKTTETPKSPVEPKPKEKVISAKNGYTFNRKVQGDPTRNMPDYKGLLPPGGDPGSGNYVRPITLSKFINQSELDTTKIIDGKFAAAGFEANLIAEGFQTAYLTKYSWINDTPYQEHLINLQQKVTLF